MKMVKLEVSGGRCEESDGRKNAPVHMKRKNDVPKLSDEAYPFFDSDNDD